MTISIQEFYKDHTIDPDFDEINYVKQKPETKNFYKKDCEEAGIDDKHRLFYHYMVYVRANESQDICSFYSLNTVDEDFDHIDYLSKNPETKNFYKEYCDDKGITDRQRLFYHSVFYGDYSKNDISSLLNLANKEHLNIKSLEDLDSLSIDEFLPPHEQFIDQYIYYTDIGKKIARDSKIAIVGLARNCQEKIRESISIINSINSKESQIYIFENDSKDETKKILKKIEKKHKNITAECINNNRDFLKNRFRTRTNAFAEYRNTCLEWVKNNCSNYDYVIVLDCDADLGFSLDGVYNSIGWFQDLDDAGGIGSYSLLLNHNRQNTVFAHYDSFAVRLNDWKPTDEFNDQNNSWFRQLHPLIGSPPFHLYSCFGGLAVYKMEAFISGKYSGELGCEHVKFHKDLYENGYKMYLNSSSRFFSEYKNYLK